MNLVLALKLSRSTTNPLTYSSLLTLFEAHGAFTDLTRSISLFSSETALVVDLGEV
jgi:hypothetical protein